MAEITEIEKDEVKQELARVTRDYEDQTRELERMKEMNRQLLQAYSRKIYKQMCLKVERTRPRRWK